MQWLVHHDRNEEALNILAKYHSNGDLRDELVQYEYNEICVAIRLEEENKKTRFVDFLKTPGNRRRLLVLLTMATGTVRIQSFLSPLTLTQVVQNWIGNSIISYYLTPVLHLVGITDPTKICRYLYGTMRSKQWLTEEFISWHKWWSRRVESYALILWLT